MKPGFYISLLYRPATGRELAVERSEISAVIINALNGILVVAAISFQMLSMYTASLVILMTILFGPLIGFIISSLYTRVEMTVGRRLGGKATLDELYRLFAWSFLPAGLAVLLLGMIMLAFEKPSTTTEFLAAIPSLVIICAAIRNYCSNIIAAQRFTVLRGMVSLVVTPLLFLTLIVAGAGLITILFRCGAGESLMSILSQQ